MMAEISQWDHSTINLSQPRPIASVDASPSAEAEAILNDDVMIEVAPARASATIRVKLFYEGRSTPIPAEDPWAE